MFVGTDNVWTLIGHARVWRTPLCVHLFVCGYLQLELANNEKRGDAYIPYLIEYSFLFEGAQKVL